MSIKAFSNCDDCGREIQPNAAFAWFDPTRPAKDPFLFCSRACLTAFRAGVPSVNRVDDNAREGVGALNARKGVIRGERKKPRKLSRAEIKRRSRPREAEISKAIAARLEGLGIWNTRTQSGAIKTFGGHVMQLCRKGTPDRVFNYGLNVWVEVKRSGEKPSAEQMETLQLLRENGSLAFALDDASDLGIILETLKSWEHDINELNAVIQTIGFEIQAKLDRAKENRSK